MAAFVLTDTAIYAGAADLTGYSNKVELAAAHEEKDATTFASAGWTESRAGLSKVSANVEGFFDAGTGIMPDDRMFTDLGNAGVPWTCAPLGPADGGLAYFTSALRPEYGFGGQVGDMLAYKSRITGDGKPLVRGTIIHPSTVAKTTTGTGTAQLIGAASASQRIYAALHVLSVSGTATPTLTVTVQSDTTGFPSPATSISFTAATAIGGQFLSVAGPLTDTFFRVSYVISGTNPSFVFVVVVGIDSP